MSSVALLDEEELCPNCGHQSRLVEYTGWCPQCTLSLDPESAACTTCGGFYKKKGRGNQCWDCKREAWFVRNADRVEKYLIEGLTLTDAIKKVSDDIRPTCAKCGEEIKGGKEGAQFCNKNSECEKASYHYKALRKTGLGPDVALAIAVGRVTVLT